MGKNKKPEPEPEKIIRALGENLSIEVSEDEKKFRNRNGPDDINDVSKDKLKCTVCAKSVADALKKGNEPNVHMLLNVLMCKECSSFYGDGYFSVDEDGDDKYCRWCGQGGTLYLCSSCTCAFCKKCIKQNLSRQDVKDLDSDDWKCLICKPKPLFECRTVCWFLQENAKKKKEESEDKESNKGKRTSSHKNEETRGSKRKASDDAVERHSKRQKSVDSGKESIGTRRKSSDVSSPHRRSRSRSVKEVEGSDDEKMKTLTNKTERLSKRRGSQLENELTPTSVSSRTSKKSSKIEEVVISDDDEDTPKPTPKKIKNQASKKDISKKSQDDMENKDISKKSTSSQDDMEKKDRPRRSVAEKKKEVKSPETPKKPSKPADKKSKSSSEKNKKTKKCDKFESPVKRSHRTTKNKISYKDKSDDESKTSDSQLISLDNNYNSDSESENKRTAVTEKEIKSKSKTTLHKSKLHLSKDADTSVIQTSGYINSAINDVLELTVLIASRCEKLCSRSVQSDDDLLNVLKKLKQLMGGVHTNLELIEKGLDTKINEWKGEEETVKKSEDDAKAEMKLSEEDKVEVSSSPDKKKVSEEETESTSSNKEESKENLKEVQEMEVDEQKIEKEKNIVRGEPKEKVEESMDIDNESQDSSFLIAANDSRKVEPESVTNSEVEKHSKSEEELITLDESCDKVSCDSKDSDDEKKSDAIDEKDDCTHLTEGNESINKTISKDENDDCKTQESDELNENDDSIEMKSEIIEDNNDSAKTKNGKIENSESDKAEKNEDEEEQICESSTIEDKCEKSSVIEEENNSACEDVPNCLSENDVNNDHLDDCTKQSNCDKSITSQENGFLSSDSINLVEEIEPKEKITCNKQEEVSGQKEEEEEEEEEEDKSELCLDESLSESENNLRTEENAHVPSPAKQTEDLKNGSLESEDVPTEKKEESKQEHNSSELKSTEKKEDKSSRTENQKTSTEKKEEKSSRTEDQKTSPPPQQHSDRDSSRDRHRWSGSRDNRDRGHSWNRDRDQYSQERWSSGRGGSWNRYEDRRSNRGGGWGWKR